LKKCPSCSPRSNGIVTKDILPPDIGENFVAG
jgi:hypothetical protein